MTALIVIGCILLFFIFLLSIKFKITIGYSEEISLTVKVLGIKIRILPAKSKKGPQSMSPKKAKKIREKLLKKKKKKNEASRKKAAAKAEAKEHPQPKQKKSLSEILYIIKLVRALVAKVIKKFFGHLRIDIARIKVNVATGDAASTAIAYGAVTQAINLLFPVLQQIKNFKLPDDSEIDVRADFVSDSMTMDLELSFSLRIWHLFSVAFGALGTLIGFLIKNPKPEKKPTDEQEDNGHKVGGASDSAKGKKKSKKAKK